MTRPLTILTALLLAAPALAQPTRPGGKPRGKIEEAEIEIVKERVNELPAATRNFDKIKLAPPPKPERKVAYTYPDFRLPADRLNPSVRVLTIRAEEPAPLTGNYVKAGLGNYGTLYGRAHLHSTRTTDKSYGLDIRHVNSLNGPVDGKNSGVSESSAALSGELYRGTAALGANLDVGRERYNFYGYERPPGFVTPEAAAIKQVFNRFALKTYARNRDPDQTLQYDAAVGFRRWSDRLAASENDFTVKGKAGYALTATSRLTLAADASFISQKDSALSRGRTFVQATPSYEMTRERLTLQSGITLGYSSDTTNGVGKLSVYPAVRVGYAVLPEKLVLYGGFGGALQRVTLYDLSTENPWLNRQLTVADTRRGTTAYVGFNSTPARGLELNARATYARDRNLYFYRNSPADPARFDLVYDRQATGLLNVHAEVLYGSAEHFRLGARFDYTSYRLNTLPQPFHRPEVQATVFASYNVFDKLLLGVETYFLSASYGISYNRASGTPFPDFYRATDPIYDLNLRADYRITPKFSIFVLGNNLAGRQYQRFYGYPVKGINAIGGASYTF